MKFLFSGACLFLLTVTAGHPSALAADDHALMMERLGIETLRRGADGDPSSPHSANYDEAKANDRMKPMPDPLVFDDGRPVRSARDWPERRAEIVEHFSREIYGRVPGNAPDINWEIKSQAAAEQDGLPVLIQHLVGRAVPADGSAANENELAIRLTLTRPSDADGPVPVVLSLTVSPEWLERFRSRFTEEQMRAFNGGAEPWQHQVLRRGWAAAELVASSIQPDSGEGLRTGVIGLANNGRPREPEDWGALRAWAWGVSRSIDYFEHEPTLDTRRVMIQGHSRYGKAALVAMAYEPRLAAAYISSSGEGGAKLWRRHYGEQVGNIAGSGEYHWMAGNFLRYAGPLDVTDLPVDSHHLIALCAPRPVFIGSGTEGDQWVDPRGMFLAAALASPVYQLLGTHGLESLEYPAIGTALTSGELAWRQHEFGHSAGPNWSWFLDFAARYVEP